MKQKRLKWLRSDWLRDEKCPRKCGFNCTILEVHFGFFYVTGVNVLALASAPTLALASTSTLAFASASTLAFASASTLALAFLV